MLPRLRHHPAEDQPPELADALLVWLRDPSVDSIEVDVDTRAIRVLGSPGAQAEVAAYELAGAGDVERKFQEAIERAVRRVRPEGIRVINARGTRQPCGYPAGTRLNARPPIQALAAVRDGQLASPYWARWGVDYGWLAIDVTGSYSLTLRGEALLARTRFINCTCGWQHAKSGLGLANTIRVHWHFLSAGCIGPAMM